MQIFKPTNSTICNALEQFSNNIDCALRIMLDACTIEAQNVAVAVQDALNDDFILHHCYADAVIDPRPIDNGGFRLNPRNERCSSEQVCMNDKAILMNLFKNIHQFSIIKIIKFEEIK
ncbi:unnamed protein product [Onchocerca flexuosa]|uniref:Uncharacterized protein n=1 Tax=Onchocerca flexuosa TaxID=387005 RepID=A0A183HUT6_9BILA|nr:unnamed protein product [Onchocerca flexuosa]